jgi:FKBP-type peptidyl-prolyl cis-trans isomerase FkpA
MSVTAVPIRPIKKGSLVKLWIGLGLLAIAAMAVAWFGTAGQNYTTTASGLQYRIVKQGEGPQPGPEDVAVINYTGRLQDGTVFDSNEGAQPAPLPVGGSIPGFSEGLQMMRQGARYSFRIPPELAYGPEGAGGVIPPNATLDFDVTLQRVVTRAEMEALQRQQMEMMQRQGAAGN